MHVRRLFRTASFRFATLYLLLFAASAVILGATVFWITRTALNGQAKVRIESEVISLRGEYQTGGLQHLVAAVEAHSRGSGALDYLVQGADGRRIAGEIAPIGPRLGWLRLDASDQANDPDPPELVQALAVSLPGGIVLAVGDDLHRVAEAEEAILRAFAWAFGLTAVLGITGGAWLSHTFLRRVDAIGRTAEAIIGGDLTQRVPVSNTGDDLDRLAHTLNRMLDRIAHLMESLRQVSTDIAHDLRTPLSHLCHRLEEVRAGGRSLTEYQRAVDDSVVEAEGLLATFAALLRIAQVEGGIQRAAFHRVNLSQLVDTVAEAFAPAAEDEGHALVADIGPDLSVDGDQELLSQMVVNLVENAIRHTPQGSHIRVVLAAHRLNYPGSGPVLAVEDDGPGVPADERGRVLHRFYRLEQSRTTPGSGLGLSLIAAVAELHGARLNLEDAKPGLRVNVIFPRGV